MLDDGFQHRAIARDFDLVLVDGRRGALLPAGPLREPPAPLRRARCRACWSDATSTTPVDPPVPTCSSRSTARISRRRRWWSRSAAVWHEQPIGRLAGRRVVAVTGIARPEPFYALLRRWEAAIEEVFEYPDHHRYTAEDWQRIARRGHDVDLIVTTEKDLVKLEAFPFATGKLVALRIAPQVEHGAELLDDIAARVGLSARPAKETPNGHQ